jgi:hypothetical protein
LKTRNQLGTIPAAVSQLLTTQEAARILNVAKNTMVRWRCEGVGPNYYKFEHSVRYDLSELNRYMQSRMIVSSVRPDSEDDRVSV